MVPSRYFDGPNAFRLCYNRCTDCRRLRQLFRCLWEHSSLYVFGKYTACRNICVLTQDADTVEHQMMCPASKSPSIRRFAYHRRDNHFQKRQQIFSQHIAVNTKSDFRTGVTSWHHWNQRDCVGLRDAGERVRCTFFVQLQCQRVSSEVVFAIDDLDVFQIHASW